MVSSRFSHEKSTQGDHPPTSPDLPYQCQVKHLRFRLRPSLKPLLRRADVKLNVVEIIQLQPETESGSGQPKWSEFDILG